MNWMDKKYSVYWQGISVHNGDILTNTDYDAGLGSLISGIQVDWSIGDQILIHQILKMNFYKKSPLFPVLN